MLLVRESKLGMLGIISEAVVFTETRVRGETPADTHYFKQDFSKRGSAQVIRDWHTCDQRRDHRGLPASLCCCAAGTGQIVVEMNYSKESKFVFAVCNWPRSVVYCPGQICAATLHLTTQGESVPCSLSERGHVSWHCPVQYMRCPLVRYMHRHMRYSLSTNQKQPEAPISFM